MTGGFGDKEETIVVAKYDKCVVFGAFGKIREGVLGCEGFCGA